MNKLNNWAYGFALNHEGAGVGTIYYAERYFDKEGIVNPASAEAYTTEDINAIKAGAVEGATNYVSEIPKEALIGMNVLYSDKMYWYDEEASTKILKSANPLILDKESGDMKDTEGNLVVAAI
ncbi:MAG: hypothetical protein IKH54_03720 [Bacilli bacterium]|nr:hypothetical protein [Bacilli bacterium]